MEIDPVYNAAIKVHMAMAFDQAALVFLLVLLSVITDYHIIEGGTKF